MRQCIVEELVSLRGEKQFYATPTNQGRGTSLLFLLEPLRTMHHEWSTLITARLPVARLTLTILDRLVGY